MFDTKMALSIVKVTSSVHMNIYSGDERALIDQQ